MRSRVMRSIAVAGLATAVVMLAPGVASAHEEKDVGPITMAVGFGAEPAYVGQPNSVQVILSKDGKPVVDLGDSLGVEVTFGDSQPLQLSLEPEFEIGEFGTPGDYRGWFIPTSAGSYTFHFTGSVEGTKIDETFVSGPQTFSDVETGSDLQYPAKQPSPTELSDKIDREVTRLNDSIGNATSDASAAADDASTAKTIGFIGIALGAIGLVVASFALVAARRKPTTTS
jgi:hypothetical protein